MRVMIDRIAEIEEKLEALAADPDQTRERIDLLNKKVNDFQQRLAGARKQMDDPSEVQQLEKELAAAKQELEKLKAT